MHSTDNYPIKNSSSGFTLMELLIAIGIIGILLLIVVTAVISSRNRAYDVRIKNSVRQLRLLAESVYDGQGGSYANWADDTSIADRMNTILEDINKNYGSGENVTIIRDTQESNYCISAPKRTDNNLNFCIDATGILQETTDPCPDYPDDGSPLRCGG